MTTTESQRAGFELERRGIQITTDRTHVDGFATDFGGLVRRTPALVASVTEVEQVPLVLAVAQEHGLSVTARGSGHGQAGQCLTDGGIVLDMLKLDRVVRVDDNDALIEVEAGANWHKIIDASKARGLLPHGLTHVTAPTIGGTLSIAGVGAESWSVGAQVNHVKWLDVATVDGRLSRCSPRDNPELFDAVRSGLGQCGIIVRAGYPVRRSQTMVRYASLLYDEADRFVADVARVCVEQRADFLTAMFVAAEGPRPWSLLLMLGKEHGDAEPTNEIDLAQLGFARALPTRDVPVWTDDGAPGHMFFRRYDPPPGPQPIHPWVEHLFTPAAVVPVLDEMLSGRVLPLQLGTNAIIIVARAGTPAPLFAVPPGEEKLLFGVGMFVAVPDAMRDLVLVMMTEHSEALCRAGGKRYLSGFLAFRDEAAWAAHFGAVWPIFCESKRRWDPGSVLGRGVVAWPT